MFAVFPRQVSVILNLIGVILCKDSHPHCVCRFDVLVGVFERFMEFDKWDLDMVELQQRSRAGRSFNKIHPGYDSYDSRRPAGYVLGLCCREG